MFQFILISALCWLKYERKDIYYCNERLYLYFVISIYSLKWLHIFSANMFHPKLVQPSLKRTALSPATVLTFLVSGSLILSLNRRSPKCSPFNNKTLIENHYEVCLILIKEIFLFTFIPEVFSRFQEMNDAKLYAATCHNLTAVPVTKVLSEYINSMSWKTGDRVLDLGCGPGIMTTQVLMPRLPEDFGLLVGADLSANKVQYASETYEHSKLKFRQFDLTKDIGNTSQLQPSDFDKIFSFFLMHWIPDHRYYLTIKPRFDS